MNYSNYDAHILIVDDQVENIHILGEMLSDSKYRVGIAESGEQALKAIPAVQPDLILLDVMMPGMDGFETCRHLKSSPDTSDIPVIFLTAKDSLEDILKGFEVGAADYITKPFQQQEVLVRADSQISLRQYQKQLKVQKERLEEKNRELTLQKKQLEREIHHRKRMELSLKNAKNEAENTLRELVATQNQLLKTERMAGIANLVVGMAHQINTPLGIGVSESSFVGEQSARYSKKFEQGTLTESDLKAFFQVVSTASSSTMKALKRASRLMSSFKQVSVDQVASGMKAVCFQLKKDIEDVVWSFQTRLDAKNITIAIDCSEDIVVSSYPLVICEILNFFITNTLEHAFEEQKEGKIWISAIIVDSTLLIRHKDNGVGMDAETRKKIFDPFYTTSPGRGSFGLGLHIVYNLVTQKLNGEINCISNPGKGTEFIVEMPLD